MADYVYSGDASLEYGGSFIDLSDWQWGYCNAVRVTDLDSGCGFRGAVLIEHVTIFGLDDPKRIRQACESCGWVGRIFDRPRTVSPEQHKKNLRHAIADALLSYGYYDPADRSETVQMEPDGPMRFDGWRADKRLHNTDLRDYVESVHLNS